MEADNSKQYSLRWEKHAFNLASEAGCFFEDESFLDCTLSAEGQCIEAHKIILSAASSYLSNLLKIMPDKHPILIFNDIKFEQLKSLVAFIYNGSVNVSENNIHAFLNAAQSLLIKGLSEDFKDEDKTSENNRKSSRNLDIQDMKMNCKKNNAKLLIPKRTDFPMDPGRNFKRQRQILPKSDGPSFVECEESLSKLQEISITKYIHQNLNSKTLPRNEVLENKWNGPVDEKLRASGNEEFLTIHQNPSSGFTNEALGISENYVVKSWKHNSVEDLNGRHKLSKNNGIKKIKLEKQTRSEEFEQGEKKKVPQEQSEVVSGNYTDRAKPEEVEDKIKKELDAEQLLIVEPKQEIIEEEDTNSEEYSMNSSNNDAAAPDSESLYENRSMTTYHRQPVVDRGIPVPLLMCRTSLSEPDSVEPNWMPPVATNFTSDHPPLLNSAENSQDLQCRTCAQDLPCPTCTKKYKSRYALNRHILYECGKARKSFSCDECGKKVTRQDTLQKHKLIHLVQHLKKKESESDEEHSKPKKIC